MEKLLDFLSTYGWGGFLVICIVFFAYFLIVKQKSLSPLFADRALQDEANLKYHPFFRYAQYRMSVELPNLHISPETPVKQQVFIDMLQLLTKRFYDTCKDITDMNMEDWDSDRWGVEISDIMVSCINSWVADCTQQQIPIAAMSKFKNWAAPNFALINEYVTILADSSVYTNNKTRTNTFFLIMNLLLVALVGDAERTLRDLNGDIAGQMYKGNVIEH
jgi:hypothetical protein